MTAQGDKVIRLWSDCVFYNLLRLTKPFLKLRVVPLTPASNIFHWLPTCQTHILTVLNKPHIYSLSEIMKQLILGSALVTESYLLISVLSSVFTGCLPVSVIFAN